MLAAMHRAFSAALAAFALLALGCASAGAGDPAREGDYDLATRLRMLGLAPQGETVRRGPYAMVHVMDARGRTLRVVADEEAGEIISILPVQGPTASHPKPQIVHA